LGLSLAQAVAKLHGSTLELSDRNPGLRVVIAVPCVEAAAAGAAPALGGAPSPPSAANAAAATADSLR
jgi:hypothetical protein